MQNNQITINKNEKLDEFESNAHQEMIAKFITHPKGIYFFILSRAQQSIELGYNLTSQYLSYSQDLLKVKNTYLKNKEEFEALDIFMKNLKVYQIRFALKDQGRAYYFEKKPITYPNIVNESIDTFQKKYLDGNYFGNISLDQKKDLVLDNMLNEVESANLNTPALEEKMQLCLSNEQNSKINYNVESIDRFCPNLSKTEKFLLTSFTKIFLR